ncbi:MAG TPA: helix-turn-helix domain-containing protein [Micromonosporaceae bacterium]|jgi:DNA-binding HxlR family transcriptional regulator
MGSSYRQFCPVAKAMELLDERWTLLIIRELIGGGQGFNDLRRGVPRMSPTLLSRRLHRLTMAGIVYRPDEGADARYALTPAGRELRPIVESIGAWGIRWVGELGDEDLDPKLLLWDMHRSIDRTKIPVGRSVVAFTFSDVAPSIRDWWLVITAESADVCDVDPGFPISATVTSSLRCMTEIWRGDITWADGLRSGTLRVEGAQAVRRALPRWFTLSSFAAVPRPA